MDYLYRIYKNVIKMITEPHYRDLDLIDPQLTIRDFEIQMQNDKYVKISAKKSDNIFVFYLLHYDSEVVKKFQEFKKILNKIPKDAKHIYFVSNKAFSSPNYRMIMFLRDKLQIRLLDHETFAFEAPKHILVSNHRIMKMEEVVELFKNLSLTNGLMLPKILDSDAQCVWIGSKPLDIIKITRNTISGESIIYKLVVGATSKKITSVLVAKHSRRPYGTKIVIPSELIVRPPKKMTKKIKAKKRLLEKVNKK